MAALRSSACVPVDGLLDLGGHGDRRRPPSSTVNATALIGTAGEPRVELREQRVVALLWSSTRCRCRTACPTRVPVTTRSVCDPFTRMTSPMATSASLASTATSVGDCGKRPSRRPSGWLGLPGVTPISWSSSGSPFTVALADRTARGPTAETPSTAATCSTTAGSRRLAWTLARADSEYTRPSAGSDSSGAGERPQQCPGEAGEEDDEEDQEGHGSRQQAEAQLRPLHLGQGQIHVHKCAGGLVQVVNRTYPQLVQDLCTRAQEGDQRHIRPAPSGEQDGGAGMRGGA